MPPSGSASIASSTVAGRPIASNTKSGPPSVRSRSASTVAARSSVASRPSVAPSVPCHVQLGLDPVDRHDPRGTCQRGAHHARQPDAPEPDDRDARAGRHRGGLEDGPDPGRHATADERRDRRIDAVGEGDGGGLGDDGRAGHRADPAIRQHRLSLAVGQDRGAVGHPVAERRGVRDRPTAGRRRRRGRRRTGRATTGRPAGRPTATERPARRPRRRRRPRGPSRSGSGAASRRRARGGRSGRRPTPGS